MIIKFLTTKGYYYKTNQIRIVSDCSSNSLASWGYQIPASLTSHTQTFSLGSSSGTPTASIDILTSTNPFCEIKNYQIHSVKVIDGTYHSSFIKAVRWNPNKATATSFYWDIGNALKTIADLYIYYVEVQYNPPLYEWLELNGNDEFQLLVECPPGSATASWAFSGSWSAIQFVDRNDLGAQPTQFTLPQFTSTSSTGSSYTCSIMNL